MKGIMLPFEKYSVLRELTQAEAGEVIQMVLNYAIDGKRPVIKDRYKEMFYAGLFASVDEQRASAEMRADKCRKVALQNASKMKEAKRVLARQKRTSETQDGDTAAHDILPADSNIASTGNANAKVASSANDATARDVTSADLTFAAFTALYGKKDAGDYNTEALWLSMSDADRRKAIAYINERYVGKIEVSARPWPNHFLKSGMWKTSGTNL